MKKVIFDTNNIANVAYYRAKATLQKEENKDNTVLTNFTIKIFFSIFHMYLKNYSQHKFYLVWDGQQGSSWRKSNNEMYKSNRNHSKDDTYHLFLESMKIEQNILSNYPVVQIKFDDTEADDIIYNLCDIYRNDSIDIISSDQDLIQLSQKFNNVKIYNPIKKSYYDVPEYDIVTYKSIAGDSSDNIQGLYNFGPAKTLKVINNQIELTAEQKAIVENNKILIDLNKNPNVENNKNKVIDYIDRLKINTNAEQIKLFFVEYKQHEFLKKWNEVLQLLHQLSKETALHGEEKS